jgi:hypothetical protein
VENDKGKFIEAWVFATVVFASDTSGYVTCSVKYETYSDILERIISGQSRGVSPEIITRKFECSICNNNYEKCFHEEGKYYDGIVCKLIAKEIEFIGGAIVDEPKDPKCRVNDLLIIWAANGSKTKLFEWYGFELHTEKRRFQDIEDARKKGLISDKSALKLSELFSVNLFGAVRFKEKLLERIVKEKGKASVTDTGR